MGGTAASPSPGKSRVVVQGHKLAGFPKALEDFGDAAGDPSIGQFLPWQVLETCQRPLSELDEVLTSSPNLCMPAPGPGPSSFQSSGSSLQTDCSAGRLEV